MPTLGFEISDRVIACSVNSNGKDTIPVCGSDGTPATEMIVSITGAGPVFGNAAYNAIQSQLDLPAITELLGTLNGSRKWYQDSCDKYWNASDILQMLFTQTVTGAREVAFERNWQSVLAVETEYLRTFERWRVQCTQATEWSIQAIVSRQSALAAHWAAMHPARQTVVTIDWAPRQIHLCVFTCGGGKFKLLHTKSIAGVGLIALEETIRQALLPDSIEQCDTASANPEVASATAKLWRQAISEPSGVGKQECWIDGSLTELVLCREHLQDLAESYCQRVISELSTSLEQMGLQATDADRFVLVGGPNVFLRSLLINQTGLNQEIFAASDALPDVASGAALLSGLAPAQLKDILLAEEALRGQPAQSQIESKNRKLDNCDIGLRIGNPISGKSVIYKLIDAQAELPAHRSRTFRTSRPNQSRLVLDVVYVEPATGRITHQETRSLLLPPNLPAYAPVDVTAVRHASGQVEISCPQIARQMI